MSAPAPSMFTPAAAAMAEKLGLKKGRANLEEFADTLLELARADRNIVAVTSDSRGSGKLAPFGQTLPKQIVEVGIAEQNLVGITAGLAAAGKKAFGVSPSCFLTARSLEQIKNDVCYSNVPSVLVGISSGVSYGALGSTHHSLHDLAVLRAIHNLTIVVPADAVETRAAISFAAQATKPVFVRFGKAPMYALHANDVRIDIGSAVTLRDGRDVAFLATGETVVHALLAAAQLADQGVSARVVSFHTVKPLDTAAVLAAGQDCRAIITVEEHSVHGGFGEACASALLQAGVTPRFKIVGFPDEDTVTGAQADLFRHYGISMEGLAASARDLLKSK
ncbi:MAG TPA: transketolase C-terminal domain-containing protein [Opitutaceae bacterium]|nr:transketolase C-terminal domain-containing protein [Opitutaceae bacterium]